MEAQACECPVLVTPSGGLPEAVVDGVTGRVLPHDRPEAMQKLLLEMLADPQQLRQMGIAARQRILREFTWDKTALRLQNLILKLKANEDRTQSIRIDQPAAEKSPHDIPVGFITTYNQKCGFATYASYLIEHYPPDKTVIFAEDSLDDRLGPDPANVYRLWRRGKNDFSALENAIKQADSDVVHINY